METLERTREEQAEYVKELIRRYWILGVVVVVGSIGSVYGINAYKQKNLDQLNKAATGLATVNQHIDDKQLASAETELTKLQKENADSSLPMIGSLELAKAYFEAKDYAKAIKQYDWIIGHEKETALVGIAKIRKARVLATENKKQEAIDLLKTVKSEKNKREVALLTGDLYSSMEKYDEAIKAYQSVAKEPLLEQRIQLAQLKQEKLAK